MSDIFRSMKCELCSRPATVRLEDRVDFCGQGPVAVDGVPTGVHWFCKTHERDPIVEKIGRTLI
jgi:hypothetical protein